MSVHPAPKDSPEKCPCGAPVRSGRCENPVRHQNWIDESNKKKVPVNLGERIMLDGHYEETAVGLKFTRSYRQKEGLPFLKDGTKVFFIGFVHMKANEGWNVIKGDRHAFVSVDEVGNIKFSFEAQQDVALNVLMATQVFEIAELPSSHSGDQIRGH